MVATAPTSSRPNPDQDSTVTGLIPDGAQEMSIKWVGLRLVGLMEFHFQFPLREGEPVEKLPTELFSHLVAPKGHGPELFLITKEAEMTERGGELIKLFVEEITKPMELTFGPLTLQQLPIGIRPALKDDSTPEIIFDRHIVRVISPEELRERQTGGEEFVGVEMKYLFPLGIGMGSYLQIP